MSKKLKLLAAPQQGRLRRRFWLESRRQCRRCLRPTSLVRARRRSASTGLTWKACSISSTRRLPNFASICRSFPRPGRRPEGRGVAGSGRQVIPEDLRVRLEGEVGDLFFVLVNIARYLALDPESALRKTNRKFRRRFQWMEQRLHERGRTPEKASMDELESLWQQAKRQEKQS